MVRRRERTFLALLAGNTAVGFVGNALQRTLTFTITLILARGLRNQGFGLYSYVVAYMFFFSFLSDLGVERAVTREVSRTPQFAGELLGSAIAAKLGLSLLAMAASIGTAWMIDMPRDAFVCVVLSALGFPLGIEYVFRGYFQSRYQAIYTYAIMLPGTLWFLITAIVVTTYDLPLYMLFASGLVVAPFIVGTLLWMSHYHLHLALEVRWSRIRRIFRDSLEFGGFIFLFMLSMRLDQVLLFHLRGDVEVSRYAIGVRLSEAMSLIPEAVLVTVFPLLVSSEKSAPERFRETYRLGFKYLAAVGVLMALGLTVLRHEVVDLLYGAEYADAAPALAVLAWNMFFGYVGVIYMSLFVAQSRQRLLLIVSAAALAVNVVLNLLWIPPYGATGAAAATLAANVAGFGFWLLLRETRPYMVTCLRESWRALIAALFLAATVRAASLDGVGAAAVIVLVYPLLLWLFGGVGWSDVALVQRLFASQDPQRAS